MKRTLIKSGLLLGLLAVAGGIVIVGRSADAPKPGGSLAVQVNPKHSGYAAGADDWKRFLGCWQEQATPRAARNLPFALRGAIRADEAQRAAVLAKLDAAERRLGVKLPKSYRDFMLAFAPMAKPGAESVENYTGLLPPSQIGFVHDLSPQSVQLAAEYPSDAPDEHYLVYGEGQDDAAFRSSYVARAILIGKYGRDSFEQILLYPQLVTEDGEMEAALGYHAGQFRAPSFAELMRQLSVLEMDDHNTSPPYPQALLRGSCAERLPLREVWWK